LQTLTPSRARNVGVLNRLDRLGECFRTHGWVSVLTSCLLDRLVFRTQSSTSSLGYTKGTLTAKSWGL
jgi:hypothetical protein